MFNIARCLRHEPGRCILQCHRVQGEASCSLSTLDQVATTESVESLKHLNWSPRHTDNGLQLPQTHWLTQDSEPEEHYPLKCRDARIAHLASHARRQNYLALLQEQSYLAPKKIRDGLRYDL